ncbi:MAG: hypothetical protein OER88_09590, partial [Planctomycetota bacterium]|nr:hypothetical protein [Planctomycetota bacterium]
MRRSEAGLDPVLVDFGLAVTAGAQRAGEASGTLPYIAPEILAGGVASPASDVFSLGMLLFDVATGRHVADFGQLLADPDRMLAPERVRRNLRRLARNTVPRRFEDLVSRMVAPTPAGRFRSAADALRAMADQYGAEYAAGAADLKSRVVLGEPPLVGRRASVEALVQRVDALREGMLLAPVVVAAGAAGSGVSRLLATVRNRASVLGCVTAAGASLRDLAADLATHPSVAEAGDPGATPGDHVFRVDTIVHELPAESYPALFLDDVHTFTEDEVASLREWVQAVEGRPGRAKFMLVCGGRNDGDGPGVEFLKTAAGSVPLELRDLAPLKQGDVRKALAVVLGQPRVPSGVVQALLRASAGNPRALSELLRLLVDEGVLDLAGERPELDVERMERMRLPRSVADVVQRRLRKLPKDQGAAARRFALVPVAVHYDAAHAVAGNALSPLIDEGVLSRTRGRIAFASELLRRAADMLQGADRVAAQKEVADAIVEFAPGPAALLLLEAGAHDEAAAVGAQAGHALLERGDVEFARDLLARVFDATGAKDAGALLLDALVLCGRAADAAELGLRLVEAHPDTALALRTVSPLRTTGREVEALRMLNRFDKESRGGMAARVTSAKASLLASIGRSEEALMESGRAEAALGDLYGSKGRVAVFRAAILQDLGRYQEAARIHARLLELPEDEVVEAARHSARLDLSNFRFMQGRLLRAIRGAHAIGSAAGSRARQARSRYLQGAVLFHCGRPRRAEASFRAAREVFQRTGRKEETVRALAAEAVALMMAGRPVEAEARLKRAESVPGILRLSDARIELELAHARRRYLAGRETLAFDQLKSILDERTGTDAQGDIVFELARMAQWMEPELAETWWSRALEANWRERLYRVVPWARVGLAQVAASQGAWNRAEQLLGRREYDALLYCTSLRAQATLVRAGVALSREETAAACRLLEETVTTVNRCGHVPARARVY